MSDVAAKGRKPKPDPDGFEVDDTPGPPPDDVETQNVPEDDDTPPPAPDLPETVGDA